MDDYESPLTSKDKDDLKTAFNKIDKKSTGSIKPNEIADVFRMAGQNPTVDETEKMIQEANEPGTGMLMFDDMIPIVEKYWKSYENYVQELKDACLAFDTQDMGIIEFEDLKKVLIKYGEQLDEDDIELFEDAFSSEGKINVDEFIKKMSPFEAENKKSKKGKSSAKISKK